MFPRELAQKGLARLADDGPSSVLRFHTAPRCYTLKGCSAHELRTPLGQPVELHEKSERPSSAWQGAEVDPSWSSVAPVVPS
jgi:hypothetical protein